MTAPSLFDALARSTDPSSSHESKPDKAATRALVLLVLPRIQPCTDEALVSACQATGPCTPSGVRSRRVELQREGQIVQAGVGRSASGRKALLWAVR